MSTTNRKFVNHIIRNVVQQNSIPDGTMPSADAQFNLNKYFDDPNTVDLVYLNMMERVRNEKSHYEQVLSRILKLVKNNIALHPPSLQILLDLDTFCLGITSSSILLQKSITYIRALIANQVKQHPNYVNDMGMGGKNAGSTGIGSSTGSMTDPSTRRANNVGLLRTRSQSASTTIGSPRDQDIANSLQPRTSLDLTNMLQQPAVTTTTTTNSISSSASSSPQSANDSPIRTTLLNHSNGGVGGGGGGGSSGHNINNNLTSPNLASSAPNNPISILHDLQQAPQLTTSTASAPAGIGSVHHTLHHPQLLGVSNLAGTLRDSNASIASSSNTVFSSSNGFSTSPTLLRRAFNEDGYICDLMSMKTNNININQSSASSSSSSSKQSPKIQSLLTHSPFGGMKSSELKGKELFKCPDDSVNSQSINIVQQAKKKAEQKDLTLQFTLRRRKAPALFQYKYYSEQEPLKIKDTEKQQVLKVILNPATPQDRSIATKIFIKIISDIYCKNGVDGEKIIFGYLKQILESPNRDTRIHLFNIIFNLSVHVNIYSELRLEDGTQGTIGELQDSVFSLLRDCLNQMTQVGEKDNDVWAEALNCVLVFIVEQGNVIRHRLLQLNSQIIGCFLKFIQDSSDQTKRMLVRMLCNFLYKESNTNSSSTSNMFLNEEELNKIGGIDFILNLYTSIRSNEAKNNLFVVIFDYVLQTALKSQTIVDTQLTQESPLLLELFKRADAPHYFVQIFKCIPEKDFVSDFFLFTSNDSAKHDASYSYEDLIIKFTMKIREHAIRHQMVDQQCEKYLVLEQQDSIEKTTSLLYDWITNDADEYLRFNAENWLFNLLKRVLIDKDNNANINFSVNLFVQLASHPNPKVRKVYISLTERLILMSKYKLKTGETKSQEVFDMLNECILRITASGEKDENNLLTINDIIFDMIYSRNGTKQLYIRESWAPDTNFSLFLKNQFIISAPLLKSINISILQYLFNNISPIERFSEQRLVLVHLLILRCHDPEDLARVGGIGFFKSLLNDSCTQIAYHSSYFLLTQLESESPEQYRSILTRLLSKARENNDENLISNPFFQVQGIIEMTHKAS
ncbi:hypothetical protein DFA_07129 [Cavenderia fasciculata]|uniref:Uncharacterized protein n=1 Tax=Cavenderia fasciculata TaxID=261658 RepID=F4PVJ9_CACFS|nr:uncharacterized protein DFA_07129 [Cavenderia fasciculata]EGG20013.1 hypothetical protein DFA_07129 [Cavenderia fasciculata]|eukprot:XP_004366996.1 hypothetical protein DFA_07129 [Cavenderia fasciculata]